MVVKRKVTTRTVARSRGDQSKNGVKRKREDRSQIETDDEADFKSQEKRQKKNSQKLRKIVIDGCNVAFSFGDGEFKIEGAVEAAYFFKARGHTKIYIIVPGVEKKRIQNQIGTDLEEALSMAGILVYCPFKIVNKEWVASHDDRLIIKYSAETDAVIISNDRYRDWIDVDPAYKRAIKNNVLKYCFVDGKFTIPDKPFGRSGPSTDDFLKC